MVAERMVIVRYTSPRSGGGLTKKLLGYKEWVTRVGKKTYLHKPVVGKLDGLPVEKAGRAAILAPQRLLPEIKKAIAEEGGTVTWVEPVIMDEKQTKETVKYFDKKFVDVITNTLRYASEVQDKDLYVSAIDEGITFTKKFEALLGEFSPYSLHKEEDDDPPSEVMKMLHGLKSIADEDLEAAKLQAERFATELKMA